MNEREKRLIIYRALTTNPEWVEILHDALALQEKGEAEQAKGGFWLGFKWFDVHANPLGGREIVGAALNRLLRLSFALVKNQTYYRSPQLVQVTG